MRHQIIAGVCTVEQQSMNGSDLRQRLRLNTSELIPKVVEQLRRIGRVTHGTGSKTASTIYLPCRHQVISIVCFINVHPISFSVQEFQIWLSSKEQFFPLATIGHSCISTPVDNRGSYLDPLHPTHRVQGLPHHVKRVPGLVLGFPQILHARLFHSPSRRSLECTPGPIPRNTTRDLLRRLSPSTARRDHPAMTPSQCRGRSIFITIVSAVLAVLPPY